MRDSGQRRIYQIPCRRLQMLIYDFFAPRFPLPRRSSSRFRFAFRPLPRFFSFLRSSSNAFPASRAPGRLDAIPEKKVWRNTRARAFPFVRSAIDPRASKKLEPRPSRRLYRCLVSFSSACWTFARPRADSPTRRTVARGSFLRHRFGGQGSRECLANRWKVARSERRCSYDGEAKRRRRRRRRRRGTRRWEMARGYYAEASCRQTECHIVDMYGQLKLLPLSSISLISVSIGVFPTSRTKNSCSITCDDTVLSEGNRRSSLPNLVG